MQAKNRVTIRKKPQADGKYVIKIEGNIVWEGKKPQTKLPALLKNHRGRDISIVWKPKSESIIG
ncbi:MAG: hypothetical protein V3W18_13290 [candidate division Zixibacteria bacterium]